MNRTGSFLWIMGLAGSGKSTLAKKVYEVLVQNGVPVIWLDGDVLREALDINGHSLIERREAGLKYLNISSIITKQGINVILSSIGMQQLFQEKGRELFTKYFQVLVEVDSNDVNLLKSRSMYSNKEINVMGKDILTESLDYDIIYRNDFMYNFDLIKNQCANLLIYGKV
jgi:adenylylsulfate kinase-like enzyme